MATAQLTPAGVGIRNVLIATDFSRCSTVALDFGMELVKTYDATAYIVSVIPNDAYMLSGPEVHITARDAVLRDLEELRAELKRRRPDLPEAKRHLYLLDGDVAGSILDFAHQKKVDLIVLGTHGRGGLGKALLGSVAERVFRHSPVPVLTLGPCVHPSHSHHELRTILAAADFTPASQRAVQSAAMLAREREAKLVLLHVADPAQLRHVPDQDAVKHGLELRVTELLGSESGGPHCSVRIATGQVKRTILEVAKEEQADLLVMGVRASSGVLDHLVIPHAYEVVREAPCPVLTLREVKPTSL